MANACISATDLSVAFDHFPPVFSNLSLHLGAEPVALIGNNGSGKSVLAECLAGIRKPVAGQIQRHLPIAWLAQNSADYSDSRSVADFLGVAAPLAALDRLLAGSGEVADLECLGEQWNLREDLVGRLADYGLPARVLDQSLAQLSGGQRTRLHLLRQSEQPDVYMILDEPTNHLDQAGRLWLAHWLKRRSQGTLVITHDQDLLQHFDHIIELRDSALHHYGQGFAGYRAERTQEIDKARADLNHARGALRRERQQQQAEREKHEQRAKKGRARRAKGGTPKMLLDAMKERSEATGGGIQAKQQTAIGQEQARRQNALERLDKAKPLAFPLTQPLVQFGCLVALEAGQLPWLATHAPFNWQILAGQRWLLTGSNGSGKSVLLRILNNEEELRSGNVNQRGQVILLDQHLQLLNLEWSALDNYRRFNPGWPESDYRERLALLRLRGERALLPVAALSGGDRLKVALAMVLMGPSAYDLVLLDEPDNHLDLESQALLAEVLSAYRGALVVVTHSNTMAESLRVTQRLNLDEALAQASALD